MEAADAHDAGPVRAQKSQSEPADAHDAAPVGVAKPKMEPADAHDAGPVGARPKWNRLMLKMLGLLGLKAQHGTG